MTRRIATAPDDECELTCAPRSAVLLFDWLPAGTDDWGAIESGVGPVDSDGGNRDVDDGVGDRGVGEHDIDDDVGDRGVGEHDVDDHDVGDRDVDP